MSLEKQEPYKGIKPFSIGRVGSNKLHVMSHDHESYSQHFKPDQHAEASQTHYRHALKIKAERRPAHLVEHHMALYEWHKAKSNQK